MLSNLYLYFELAGLITIVIKYNKLKHTHYRYFLPFLLLILAYEIASLSDIFIIHKTNGWIVNLIYIVQSLFYIYFITWHFPSRLKKSLRLMMCFVAAFTLVYIFTIGDFWHLAPYSILLQFALLIVTCCYFFYRLMYDANQTLFILKLPDFWVNTGLLFFCLAEFLFYSSYTYMAYKKNYHYLILFLIISNIANAILYSCLSISFLCFKPMKKL